jgi:hypothetical protein
LVASRDLLAVPIDLYLFHPSYSPVFRWLKPHQLLPHLVEPIDNGDSDITPGRDAVRPRGLDIRRFLVQSFHEVRLARMQFVSQAIAHARWATLEPFTSRPSLRGAAACHLV